MYYDICIYTYIHIYIYIYVYICLGLPTLRRNPPGHRAFPCSSPSHKSNFPAGGWRPSARTPSRSFARLDYLLCYTILCYAILYYTILCYTILSYTIIHINVALQIINQISNLNVAPAHLNSCSSPSHNSNQSNLNVALQISGDEKNNHKIDMEIIKLIIQLLEMRKLIWKWFRKSGLKLIRRAVASRLRSVSIISIFEFSI